MPIMGAMQHYGNPEGEDSETEQRIRTEMEALLIQGIEALHGEMPTPEKPVQHMTGAELDAYERKLMAWHTRAAAAALEKTQVRKAVREIKYV
jgi:hypothetical protein